MGFDGLFLDRIDYQDRAKRWNDKTMEMVWRGSTSLKESSDIFTGVLYLNYAPPLGFCFDVDCKDASIQVVQSKNKTELVTGGMNVDVFNTG